MATNVGGSPMATNVQGSLEATHNSYHGLIASYR